MNFKKAQGTVSGLVILIGVLIILYVLLMPPCDKCELLDTSCPDYCVSEVEEGILLSVSPGEISFTDEINHVLNSVNLFFNYEPKSKILADNLEISKSWFGSIDQEFSFNMEDLEDLDSVYLKFLVMESKGEFYIYLNEKQIFGGNAHPGELMKIALPIDYLVEDNILSLYSNPPGILFWVKNKYVFKNFKLNEEFIKIHSSEERTFVLSSEEKNNIDSSELKYSFYCTELSNLANFKIYLNNNQLSSEFVSCVGEDRSIEVDPTFLEEGTNYLTFILDEGSFLINDINLKNKLEKEIYPSYSFEVDSQNEINFILSLYFDSENFKKMKVKLNGEIINIETYNSYFEQNISELIKTGKNKIELIPMSELKINKLEVRYE